MISGRRKAEEEQKSKSEARIKDRMLFWRSIVGLVEAVILIAYMLLKDKLDIPDTLVRVFGILMILGIVAQSYLIGRSLGGRR